MMMVADIDLALPYQQLTPDVLAGCAAGMCGSGGDPVGRAQPGGAREAACQSVCAHVRPSLGVGGECQSSHVQAELATCFCHAIMRIAAMLCSNRKGRELCEMKGCV